MKKVALILAGLLVIMLAGCGEGSSSSGTQVVNGGTGSTGSGGTTEDTQGGVDVVAAEVTTPQTRTPLNLSETIGTPPGLPAN